MRLIDADALNKEIAETTTFIMDSVLFQKMVDEAPTVSVGRPMGEWEHKPSKSGEWVWWQCSECGAVIYSESEVDRKLYHAYCGVCGAKMKGGE